MSGILWSCLKQQVKRTNLIKDSLYQHCRKKTCFCTLNILNITCRTTFKKFSKDTNNFPRFLVFKYFQKYLWRLPCVTTLIIIKVDTTRKDKLQLLKKDATLGLESVACSEELCWLSLGTTPLNKSSPSRLIVEVIATCYLCKQ